MTDRYSKYIAQIGGIKSLRALPCGPTPAIWVETAYETSLKLFYGYNSFDVKHIVHETAGRTWFHQTKLGFQDMIEADNTVSEATKFFAFRLVEITDQLTWYFFVAGLALEGLFDWTSALYTDTKLLCNQYGGYGYGDQCTFGAPADGIWYSAIEWRSPDWPTVPAGGGIVKIPPGKSGGLGGYCNFQNAFGDPIPAGMRIWEKNSNTVIKEQNDYNGTGTPGDTHFMWYDENNGYGYERELHLQGMAQNAPGIARVVGVGGSGYAEGPFVG